MSLETFAVCYNTKYACNYIAQTSFAQEYLINFFCLLLCYVTNKQIARNIFTKCHNHTVFGNDLWKKVFARNAEMHFDKKHCIKVYSSFGWILNEYILLLQYYVMLYAPMENALYRNVC